MFKSNFVKISLLLISCFAVSSAHAGGPRPGVTQSDLCVDLFSSFSNFSNGAPPTREAAKAHNDSAIAALQNAPIPPFYGGRFTALNFSQALDWFNAVANHPVAAQAKKPYYDPQGCMGFCFGRATAGHLEALFNKQIDPKSILKLFMVGNLKAPYGSWRYHVTPLVKALGQEGWWAADTNYTEPFPFRLWIEKMQAEYDPDGNALLFATPPQRIGPSGNSRYSPSALFLSDYNNYFTDMIRGYQGRPKKSGGTSGARPAGPY